MSNHELDENNVESLHSEQAVLDELNRLRISAARSRGKVRLSLQDLEAMSGVPKSSLANYLSGRTLMPADVLDRVVLALGVTPTRARDWARTWERVTAHRLYSRTRPIVSAEPDPGRPAGPLDEPSPAPRDGGPEDGGPEDGGPHGAGSGQDQTGRPGQEMDRIAGVLREIGTLRQLGDERGSAVDPVDLTEALTGLAKDLAEFGYPTGEVRDIVGRLLREVHRRDATHRDAREWGSRQAAQLRLIRDTVRFIEEGPRARGLAGGTGPSYPPEQPPYRGLWPFREDHEKLFHGRERLTAELVGFVERRLEPLAMVVVTGASGAGKSSLVRAGLLPALGRGEFSVLGSADWPRLVVTPTGTPLDELAVQLAALIGVDAGSVRLTLRERPDQARLLARQAVLARVAELPPDRRAVCRSGGRLVLVVDQFEELFTTTDDRDDAREQRQAYLTALLSMAATEPGSGTATGLVLLTVRGDFLDRCAGHPELVPVLQDNLFVVGPMTAGELRRAITGPAVAAGLRIEEGLADEILAELLALPAEDASGAGVLPLLSQAMLMTWHQREGDQLTRRGYGTTGGVGRVITTTADEVYDALTATEREVARHLFRCLTTVTADGRLARRQVDWAELSRVRGSAGFGDEVNARKVLDAFVARRLVVLDRGSVEIAHDVLLHAWPPLAGWVAGDRDDRLLYRQLGVDATFWYEHGYDRSFLYRGRQLVAVQQAVARWRTDGVHRPWNPGPIQIRFLQASDHAARIRQRIRRALVAGITVLALVAGVAAVAATVNASEINRQRAIALSRQLALQSQQIGDRDPVLARRLAAAAWAVSPTDEARDTLIRLLGQRSLLLGHTAGVSAVEFSSDGQLVATGGADNTVRLWDVLTGQLVGAPLAGHPGQIREIAFSPDGDLLAAASSDGSVRMWRLASATRIADFTADLGKGSHLRVEQLAFSPEGDYLITGDGPTARMWDTGTGRMVTEVDSGSASEDIRAAWDRSGRSAVQVAADGRTARIVDVTSGDQISGPMRPGESIESVALSDDGDLLAVATTSRRIHLWDASSGELLGEFPTPHTDAILALAFSADGGILGTASRDRTVRLWRTGSPGDAVDAPMTGRRSDLNGLAVGRDGDVIAMFGGDGPARIWDARTGNLLGEAGPRWSSVDTAVFDERGERLITVTVDGDVSWWSASGDLVPRDEYRVAPAKMAFSGDGRYLTTYVGGSSWVRVWNVAMNRTATLLGPVRPATTLVLNSDGSVLAVGNSDGEVQLWRVPSGVPVGEALTVTTGPVRALALSPAGDRLAAAGGDGAVRVWDVGTGQQVAVVRHSHTGPATTIEFSPDGRLLATGGVDGTVRLWDAADGRPTTGSPLVGHTGPVTALRFVVNGKLLVTAGSDGTARIWNPASYLDPLAQICALVGPPTREEWHRFVPDESPLEVCP